MQSIQKKMNLKVVKIENREGLIDAEKQYRPRDTKDYIVFSNNTPFTETAEIIIPDKEGNWKNPLYLLISEHNPVSGINDLCTQAIKYLTNTVNKRIDLLSVTGVMGSRKIILTVLLRSYDGMIDYSKFFEIMGDQIYEEYTVEEKESGVLIVPDEIKNFEYTENEIKAHEIDWSLQKKIYDNCSEERPFLNSIEKYVPRNLPRPEDRIDLIYDLKTKDMKIKTLSSYEDFTKVFKDILTFVSGVEYYRYANVMRGEEPKEAFMNYIEDYIRMNYAEKGFFNKEDIPILMQKLDIALFKYYVLQDLIDDPMVTDIKITAPNSIRARVRGKAYMSNIEFVDKNDYLRFLNGIAIKNKVKMNVPEQTFTDVTDENYILRLSLTAAYVNSVDWPYLHIRKVSRDKPLGDDLIAAGMFDEKIRDYLLDCAKHSRGVVFAGPPGSGKTICLNWFLEEGYEQSAEILVIQENDELFAYRKGVMFQHVVNYADNNNMPVNLEELGQLALVAGANVFIIGEAKGAEICSAITLSNSGCRTAITIHSYSSVDTVDKMADLALRGYAQDIMQAKRMLKSFETIVYLQDFKVKEISEVVRYDEEKGDMIYRPIYRREV